MNYPPILGAVVCAVWGCSCHGQEERVRLGLAGQGQNWAADLWAKPEISGARRSYKKEPKPAADQ